MRLWNAFKYCVFEASDLVSTKTLLLKHYYRRQGNQGLEDQGYGQTLDCTTVHSPTWCKFLQFPFGEREGIARMRCSHSKAGKTGAKNGQNPVLPFLVFFKEKGRENPPPKKQGFFIPTEPLKSLEKKGKNAQKNKELLARRKNREFQTNKERKDRECCKNNSVRAPWK